MKYKLQYNQDEVSVEILILLLKNDWIIVGYIEEDGYSWIKLKKINYV